MFLFKSSKIPNRLDFRTLHYFLIDHITGRYACNFTFIFEGLPETPSGGGEERILTSLAGHPRRPE